MRLKGMVELRSGDLAAGAGGRAARSGVPAGRSGALSFAAALTVAALACGCARHPAPPAFPYSALHPTVLVATPEGLSPVPEGKAPETLATLNGPAALVPSASVLSANGAELLVAVNRVGPVIVEPDSECRAFRLRGVPRPDPFSVLTAGGAWPHGDGFLVELYHDPFALPDSAGSGRPGTLLAVDATGAAQVLATSGLISDTRSGFSLFALYPAPQGGWLAELRRDDPDRVETRYLSAKDPEDPAPSEIRRAAFEGALAPVPLDSAAGTRGEALRHAFAALLASEGNPAGGVIVRVRGADGSDRYYYRDGDATDERRSLCAWYLDDGRALVMESGGQAALADSTGSTLSLSFAPPVAGATFSALAVCRRLAAAAWEAGDFPDLRAAGLVVLALP